MGCQLGRITGLHSPNSIRQDGDELRVAGEFVLPDDLAGVVLAQQLAGYPNPDEPVVPFVYDAHQAGGLLDGFYDVVSAEVDWAKLAAGLFSWSATLVRVPSWQSPLFEVILGGTVRDNDHTITSGTSARSWVGLPPSADLPSGYVHRTATGANMATSLNEVEDAGEAHTNLMLHLNSPGSYHYLSDGSILYTVEADGYYNGAARIEVSYDAGATWQVVPGRQIPNRPSLWRIRNDLIRCTPFSTVLIFEGYLSGWESKAFHPTVSGASATSLGAPTTVTILRNTPERCTLRLYFTPPSDYQSAFLDITVNRSAWWLDCVVSNVQSPNAPFESFGVAVTTPEAGTSSTPGIQATGDDATGNRYQFWSPVTTTKDTTNGRIYTTSAANQFPFAVSYNTLQDATLETADAYFVAAAHRQRIVAR
jgi:hypothetical protein